MTRDEFIARAIEKASVGQGEDATAFYWDVVDLHVDEALGNFSLVIALDKNLRHLLQSANPIELAVDDITGIVELTTGPGAVLLTEVLHLANITDFDGNRLDWVKHYDDFAAPNNTPFAHYTLDGKRLYAKGPGASVAQDGSFTPARGPLKVRQGNIMATAPDIPAELIDDACRFFAELLIRVREMAGRKAPGTQAARGEI